MWRLVWLLAAALAVDEPAFMPIQEQAKRRAVARSTRCRAAVNQTFREADARDARDRCRWARCGAGG